MTIGIIGCGNMGGALLKAFSKQSEHAIIAFDRSQEKVANCVSGAYRELSALLAEADILVLAVKPQGFADIAKVIGTRASGKTIVSIMAGVSIARIKEMLGTDRVIRCMPNMPAIVGEGVLGWYAEHVAVEEKKVMNVLFSLAGESIELSSESLVDHITLISGCGPAYVALFAEMLQHEAERLGFESEVAERMVLGTLRGAVRVLESGTSAKLLRERVTSKGGVTESVITDLEKNHFAETFSHGIDAGAQRMRALGTQ